MSTTELSASVTELLTKTLPEKTKESISSRNATAELDGTEITMTLMVSGQPFSYRVKNGCEIEVICEKLDNPMVCINLKEEELAQMITNNELDIIMMVVTELDKTKFNTVSTLNGTFKAELSNNDGSNYNIEVTFNGAAEPTAVFKMKTSDTALMMRKEENPVNLFMSGAMQIEGDMQFSMATQPLFI